MGLLDQATDAPADGGETDRKGHLFQTVECLPNSSRNYVQLLLIVIGVVIVGGVAFAYLTLPGTGDIIRAPKGLELLTRNYFVEKEKRTTTDITFYQCRGFVWAKVGVETRNDIPNPIYRVATYSSRATPRSDGEWDISAKPMPDDDPPCS